MNGYNTVKDGVCEIEIKRSRFIAYSYSIIDEADAEKKIAHLRKLHYDARHVCYAYVADAEGLKIRFSDDGEPGGTAGKPILDVIKNNGLKKTLIAVVRYFGGILLGAGGLTRAYSDGAAAVVKNSGSIFMAEKDVYKVETDYSTYKKISVPLKKLGSILSVEYGSGVVARIACEKSAPAAEYVADISAGKAQAEYERSGYFQSENQ